MGPLDVQVGVLLIDRNARPLDAKKDDEAVDGN